MTGQPYTSEVLIQQYETVPPPAPVKDLTTAKFGLVTSGGLVPRGNPDHQVSGNAQSKFRYSIEGIDELTVDGWESVHDSGFLCHLTPFCTARAHSENCSLLTAGATAGPSDLGASHP